MIEDNKSPLYTSCSSDELTDDKMVCSLSILPHIDQLPHMFTYVSLQRNLLVNEFRRIINFFINILLL